MDLINQILNSFELSSDPLNFIGLLFGFGISLYIFKREISTSFIQERYEKVIFPLFNLLEPFLYHEIPKNILETALCIIEENKLYADGKLLEIHYLCVKNPCQENTLALCSYIDNEYDKSCRRLGLKTRSISYRFTRIQYRNPIYILLYFTFQALFSLGIAFMFFIIFLYCCITILYTLYNSANDLKKMTMLIFGALSFWVIFRYVSKRF